VLVIDVQLTHRSMVSSSVSFPSAVNMSSGEQRSIIQLQKQLIDTKTELAKLVADKKMTEAKHKKTLQAFQEKYLFALQECKEKLKEKHNRIDALENRIANEKAAQKREEKLLSSAIFELGMGIMSNKWSRNENIDGAPDWCVCPIGHGIMINPVACADGHCYDRVNIEQWLTTHDISPRTGLQLRNKILIPIHALRNAIEEWIANNKD
jgi:hypothetical protein